MAEPTPYPAVNALLAGLLTGAQAILGHDLAGFYLDGSLALGDFDPATSDVDFLVAVARPIAPDTFAALAAMHRRVATGGRPFATELEGSYIHLAALRRHDPSDAVFPNLERGPDEALKWATHHSDWVIHRHIVREHGVVLFGPPAMTLIDPVSPGDIRAATAGVLRSWWGTPAAAGAIRAAQPGYLAYVVLTMCRALYALARGEAASKPAAAAWASRSLDNRWLRLIEGALRWQLDESQKDETVALVHLAVVAATGARPASPSP